MPPPAPVPDGYVEYRGAAQRRRPSSAAWAIAGAMQVVAGGIAAGVGAWIIFVADDSGEWADLVRFVGVVFAGIGAALLVCGIGMLRSKTWAAVLSLVGHGFVALLALLDTSSDPDKLVGLLFTAWPIIVVVLCIIGFARRRSTSGRV